MGFVDAMKMAINGCRVQRTGWRPAQRFVVAMRNAPTFRVYHEWELLR